MAEGSGRTGPTNGSTDVTRAILRRRSVRDGLRRSPIPTGTIDEIVRCGLSGPASKSATPLRLHVVTDPAVLDRIADAASRHPDADDWVPHRPDDEPGVLRWESTVAESADVLRQAGVAIVVEDRAPFTGGPGVLARLAPAALEGALFARALETLGIGAAVQNMLLAAESLGLGGAFMGDPMVAEAEIRRLLGAEGALLGVLALGWPTHRPPPHDRKPWLADPSVVRWHPPEGRRTVSDPASDGRRPQ